MIMPKLAAQVVLFDKLEMNLVNKRNMDFMDCKSYFVSNADSWETQDTFLYCNCIELNLIF